MRTSNPLLGGISGMRIINNSTALDSFPTGRLFNYIFNADYKLYAVTPFDTAISRPKFLSIAQGAYNVTGENVTFILGKVLSAASRLVAVTPRIVTLKLNAGSQLAVLNKFNLFTQDLADGVHNFKSGGISYNLILTNTLPTAANHLYSDIVGELSTGGGYTVGGTNSPMSDSSALGIEKVFATNVTWTGSGGGFGPFRYIVVYTTSTTILNKPLVGWYDFGSSISLNAGDTFVVQFDSTNGFIQVV